MSRATRMKTLKLQGATSVSSNSGAKKQTWHDIKNIAVSICQMDETRVIQSVKYKESTHSGVTYEKGIKADKNRLMDSNGDIYEIVSAAGDYRMTNLLLRRVEA